MRGRFGPGHPAVGQSLHELSKLYHRQRRVREAETLYDRAVTILGPTHPAVVLRLIERHDYEKVASLLRITPVPGDRDAAAAAVGRTFFGQVDKLRWTGLRMDAGVDAQLVVILGEATHRNDTWQAFEVEMVSVGGGWQMRTTRALPIAWR